MFRNVIVGVDGQEGGRDAVALAKVLAGEDGTITLVHVHPGESFAWRGSSPAYEALEEAESRQVLEQARSEAGREVHTLRRAAPSVGRGMHEAAEELGADLLVMGSSRRGLLGRVLIADHTRQALSGAPCAAAVAPAGYHAQSVVLREIGVGYDGSPESKHALGVARKLSEDLGTKLSAFQVVFFPARVYTGPAFPDQHAIEVMLEAARERIDALGGVESHAAYGLPGEELAIYSASLDLLVVGSRSYGPLGRLMHGSTAGALAHMARCPLLILTRAVRQAEQESADGEVRETAGVPD